MGEPSLRAAATRARAPRRRQPRAALGPRLLQSSAHAALASAFTALADARARLAPTCRHIDRAAGVGCFSSPGLDAEHPLQNPRMPVALCVYVITQAIAMAAAAVKAVLILLGALIDVAPAWAVWLDAHNIRPPARGMTAGTDAFEPHVPTELAVFRPDAEVDGATCATRLRPPASRPPHGPGQPTPTGAYASLARRLEGTIAELVRAFDVDETGASRYGWQSGYLSGQLHVGAYVQSMLGCTNRRPRRTNLFMRPRAGSPPPRVVTICVDISASMANAPPGAPHLVPMHAAKEVYVALQAALDRRRIASQTIIFNMGARCLAPFDRPTRGYRYDDVLAQMVPSGPTHVAAALDLAQRDTQPHAGAMPTIFLISDGRVIQDAHEARPPPRQQTYAQFIAICLEAEAPPLPYPQRISLCDVRQLPARLQAALSCDPNPAAWS